MSSDGNSTTATQQKMSAAMQAVPTPHDKLWAEMQMKLEDIELQTSVSKTANSAFGIHDRSLEELRKAQFDLAQAWRASEDDNVEKQSRHQQGSLNKAPEASLKPDNKGSHASGKKIGDHDHENLANQDIHSDILLAHKRREANDLHFQRVSSNVLEVVNKLDAVADAMRHVEEASWMSIGNSEASDMSVATRSERNSIIEHR